jgi:threonine synthase
MSANHVLVCTVCDHRHEPSISSLACNECGAPLTVAYSDAPDGESPRLPLAQPNAIITLGEGYTPQVELPGIAAELGVKKLWAKLEFLAPTGSFKDRGSAVLISMAKEADVTDFIEDSSGNAGASLSAYAAAAGLNAHVFAPASAGQGKKDQIKVFGAQLHEIDGPRQASTDAAEAFVDEQGLPWLSHNLSPYFMEGMKAFAYEVRNSPAANADHIIFPVGNGSLIGGAFKGYSEMREAGVIEALPRLHAVQASAIQPIIAELNGDTWMPDTSATSVASGISVTKPPRLKEIVEFVRCSYGSGVAVGEEEILAWQRRLASTAGIFAEATSAAAFAGLEGLIADGTIGADDEVLIPLTGSGLKEPLQSTTPD